MASNRKYLVYLAGPMSGCNEDQKSKWREEVKTKYARQFEFRDPSVEPIDDSSGAYRLVEADLEAIESADGLLVNMWKESIGAAVGIVHASTRGRPIVVANPNFLRNRVLDFYADAMTDTPLKAANALLGLLKAEADWTVIKSGGRHTEPFERRKLQDAIRLACRSSGCDDIVIPRVILPRIIEDLKKSDRKLKKSIAAGDISSVVSKTLRDLADEIPDAGGVVEAWSQHRIDKPGSWRAVRQQGRASGAEVASGKSHATIWGKSVGRLEDIPSTGARKCFDIIREVPGITRIRLGPFGRGGSRKSCVAMVATSETDFVIEGKLYDRGPKGTLQTFQVRVQDDADKPRILAEITAALKQAGRWGE